MLSFVFKVSNSYGLKMFVSLSAKVFPLSFSNFSLFQAFLSSTLAISSSTLVKQHAPIVIQRHRHLLVSVLPLCVMSSYPLNPKHCKMLSTLPQCILMVFLQLGLLPRYALRLLAKPFGVLTKCLPRLLLRNVHMHMRVMNNASSHARGFGVQVRLNAWLSANERDSFEKQHRLAK